MPRTIQSAMLTDLGAAAATGRIALIELQFGSGTTRVATAAEPVSWNGFTWSAVGGHLAVESLVDSTDDRGQGIGLVLSGVDTSLLGTILQEQYRGRLCRIWYAHLASSGAVVTDPVGPWEFLMQEPWEIEETRPPEGAGSVTIRTRVTSRLASWRQRRGVQCTVESHSAMLARAGVLTGGARDTFFRTMPLIAGRRILWGSTDARPSTPVTVSPGGPKREPK